MPPETAAPPSAMPTTQSATPPLAPSPQSSVAKALAQTSGPTPGQIRPSDRPRDPQGRFVPEPPPTKPRPRIDAMKALRLDQTPGKSIESATKKVREAMKPSTLSLDDVQTTPPPKAEKPAEEVAKIDETPAEAPPAPPAAAAATPPKIKVGDKEYGEEDLAQTLKELEELRQKATAAQQPPPPPVQAAPEPPAPPAPPEPTEEEIRAREEDFVAKLSSQLAAPMSTEEVDAILAGGQDAVATLQRIRQRDMATAVLQARKGIAQGLNPIIEEIHKQLAQYTPLLQQQEQLQRYHVTQQFLTKHPEFTPHTDLATQVAEQLTQRYPKEVQKMTTEQFIDEVARQTDMYLEANWKRLMPNSKVSWREAEKLAATPAPAPAPAAPPPAPVIPPPPATKPLAGNPPAAATGSKPLSFAKSVALSLTNRRG